MGWKDWPYWVKGMLVALLMLFIYYGYNFVLLLFGKGNFLLDIFLLTSAIPVAIFGAAVGWIVGKIKNRGVDGTEHKGWPYWVKGMLIGVIIIFIISAFFLIRVLSTNDNGCTLFGLDEPRISSCYYGHIFMFLVLSIPFGLAGIVVGSIVGWIKKRKR